LESYAFAVDDLDQAIVEFDRRGVTWAAEIVESPWYRYRSFYDPDGNLMHLTQPDREALGLPQ
jgi:isopenicillin-N N-acyltransferase-like protein